MPEPDMSGVVTTLLAFFGGLLAWFVIAMVVVHHATGRSRASAGPRVPSRPRPRDAEAAPDHRREHPATASSITPSAR